HRCAHSDEQRLLHLTVFRSLSYNVAATADIYTLSYTTLFRSGQPAPEEGAVYYRAAGWDEAQVAGYRTGFGGFGKAVSSLPAGRSEEHTSELQSRENLVCRLLLEKKKEHLGCNKAGCCSEMWGGG